MPAAAEPVIVDRRALAVEPGREDHAVAPGRRGRGDVVEQRVEVVGGRRLPQRVAGEDHVVAQPVEARAGDLLLVGHVVLAGQRRRQRRDAVEQVGLLERHVAREPRRRADVEMALEVAHRARTDGGRLQVGRAADHRDARRARRARSRSASRNGPSTDVAATRSGNCDAVDAEQLHQSRVVVDAREIAVVGDPVQHDRVVGGRAPTGELEVEPVLGLEVLPRRAREIGVRAPEPQDVRDRILARQRGRAAGELDPACAACAARSPAGAPHRRLPASRRRRRGRPSR